MVRASALTADLEDIRDYPWIDMPALRLPRPGTSNSHHFLSMPNQLQTNSCVGNGGTTHCEGVKFSATGEREELSRQQAYRDSADQSAVTRGRDAGTTLRDFLKAACNIGLATEAQYPFNPATITQPVPDEIHVLAGANKVTEYRRIKGGTAQDYAVTMRRIDEALATGHTVLIAMVIEHSFFSLSGPFPHAYMGMAKPDAVLAGGHCLVIGQSYQQGATDYYSGPNSWGPDWGLRGYWSMPKTTLARDLWDAWVVTEFDGCNVKQAFQRRQKVAQLYVSLFGRAPDAEGLAYWVGRLQSGESVAMVAGAMFGTAPAREFYPAFLADQEIVGAFYVNVLGRRPDADGLAYWTERMRAQGPGTTITSLIAVCADYAGADPAGIASAQLFVDKTAKALAWGEAGRGIAGSKEAIQ